MARDKNENFQGRFFCDFFLLSHISDDGPGKYIIDGFAVRFTGVLVAASAQRHTNASMRLKIPFRHYQQLGSGEKWSLGAR